MDDINKLIEILKNFEQEHRDLDEILIRLQEKNTVDFLQIQRLKKRKLIPVSYTHLTLPTKRIV